MRAAAVVSVGLAGLVACADPAGPEPFDQPVRYQDVGELFDQGIARTCSLNNGVCHNSNSYPDLHTVSALIATAGRRCNVDTKDRTLVDDVCEPAGDRLVSPSANVDVRVVWAALLPAQDTTPVDQLTEVRLTVSPAPTGLMIGAADLELHRASGEVFRVGEHGAVVKLVDGADVVVDLRLRQWGDFTARRFFDVREFPPGPNRLWVGDANHNGVEGAQRQSMPLMTPGDPMNSYLVRRMIDESFGERMPRQCRTWDDRANAALACWIQQLKVDGAGAITNAYDPIDYDACTVAVEGQGRCAPAGGVGLAAVEDIFARSCGGSSCHVGQATPAAGLDLSAGKVRAALVGVAARGRTELELVVPGDPGASYLWCKLIGTCVEREGARMPSTGQALPAAELETVRAWIADGAPERPGAP